MADAKAPRLTAWVLLHLTGASTVLGSTFAQGDGHALGVLAYRHPYAAARPDRLICARLYCRTHAHWAEFEVYDCGGFISWNGHVDGKKREGAFEISLAEEMAVSEGFWRAGELPPRYDDPLEVPFTCARSTKQDVYPSCRYFSHCWPELPSEGAFDLR